MKCKKIKLISKYFDNQLNQQEINQLLEHIKTCEVCKEEFNIFSKIYSYLPEYENVEISDDFNFRLFSKLSQETEKYSIFDLIFRKSLKRVLVPIVTITVIFLSSLLIYKNFDIKERNFSYELYPEEDIDLLLFDFILNNQN